MGLKGRDMNEVERSAEGFRARADQLRAEAETIANPETQKSLLEIAIRYELLANRLSQNSRLSQRVGAAQAVGPWLPSGDAGGSMFLEVDFNSPEFRLLAKNEQIAKCHEMAAKPSV